MPSTYRLLSLLLAIAGCGDRGPTMPTDPFGPDGRNSFEVLTQNVYVGADVDAVLGAQPEEIQSALLAALATFQATEWPARAAAIAGQIARLDPAVVALNEITDLEVAGLEPIFPDFSVEFLPILLDSLAATGAHYQLAGKVRNVDASLALGGASIRLRDYDALLIRSDLSFSDVTQGNYAARAAVPLGPLGTVDLVRGWISARVGYQGRTVRVVATHLEPKSTAPELQLGQAQELIGLLAGEEGAVLVAGDLNSDQLDPDPVTPYNLFAQAGFLDGWSLGNPSGGATGYTCCHQPDLLNQAAEFDQRIDHVLFRRALGAAAGATP
ncbi:MAG TPA: endonuclease/exonuclease/phosphatase family protein, partial [Gemmatimonadales bacterium]|nr:endonuclease/exonuclease/phosphatase family protein [Gemmatimonadales bacterium]